MTLVTTPYDPAAYLATDEDIGHYLDAALEGGDDAHFRHALRTVARARGAISSEAESPTLEALTDLLKAAGLRLRVDRLAA